MVDALNAEISLGTIANVPDAIQWLGYTYLFGVFAHSPLNCHANWESANEEGAIHLWDAT